MPNAYKMAIEKKHKRSWYKMRKMAVSWVMEGFFLRPILAEFAIGIKRLHLLQGEPHEANAKPVLTAQI